MSDTSDSKDQREKDDVCVKFPRRRQWEEDLCEPECALLHGDAAVSVIPQGCPQRVRELGFHTLASSVTG